MPWVVGYEDESAINNERARQGYNVTQYCDCYVVNSRPEQQKQDAKHSVPEGGVVGSNHDEAQF